MNIDVQHDVIMISGATLKELGRFGKRLVREGAQGWELTPQYDTDDSTWYGIILLPKADAHVRERVLYLALRQLAREHMCQIYTNVWLDHRSRGGLWVVRRYLDIRGDNATRGDIVDLAKRVTPNVRVDLAGRVIHLTLTGANVMKPRPWNA